MSWKSKYSFEILKNVSEGLEMMVLDVRGMISSVKVIVENGLRFLDEIEVNSLAKTELVMHTRRLIKKCVDNDSSGELYAISFSY